MQLASIYMRGNGRHQEPVNGQTKDLLYVSFNKRPFHHRVRDRSVAFSKFAKETFCSFYRPKINQPEQRFIRLQKEGDCLFVFFHGLSSSPQRWHKYLDDLDAKHPTVNYYAPAIRERGNCSLEKAAKPILFFLKGYSRTHVHPICLIGTSNGARLAAYIENELEKENLRIRTVTISGVHLGTNLMKILAFTGLGRRLGFHKDLMGDLSYLNEDSIRRASKWQECCKRAGDRHSHAFYGLSTDEKVWPWQSGLINIDNATYQIFHGETHSGLANCIRENVIKESLDWVSKKG